ncbi:MAG: hypothetical protein KDB82_16685 [Planctomycetes bacterium]|nr:hypothetical protein [Planctomycetota bacterium]
MQEEDEQGTPLAGRLLTALVLLFGVGAVGRGLLLDQQTVLHQPDLFWSFVVLGLGGSLLGWRFGMRHDPHVGRNALALFGVLLAWRLSYFPLMVISGWKASLVEWLTWHTFGVSIVYPTFLLVMFLQNLVIGAVASAAVAVPQSAQPSEGRLLWLRKLIHTPPRRLLWVVGAVALPVAFLTSFSWSEDYVPFADSPWSPSVQVPEIGEPSSNPYTEIFEQHGDELGLPSRVLALNAAVTYPLVPESPWGAAIKGTLEAETRANPLASSTQRIREHYLAYLAAHPRLHEDAK